MTVRRLLFLLLLAVLVLVFAAAAQKPHRTLRHCRIVGDGPNGGCPDGVVGQPYRCQLSVVCDK